MKYGVLGESDSDVATLKQFLLRLHEKLGLAAPSVKVKSYDGCSGLLRSGAAQLKVWEAMGFDRLIVHYDADSTDHAVAEARKQEAHSKVIRPSGVSIPCFACVPVQEIEAWLLADTGAVTRVIPKCRDLREYPNPERVRDPKEELIRICRVPPAHKSLYVTSMHNERVAKHVDLDGLIAKCASFRELLAYVSGGAPASA